MSMNQTDAKPAIVTHEKATAISALGDVFITLRAEDTGGQCSVVDFTLPPDGHGPELHVHETFDEIYHVLDGTITVVVDGDRHIAPAGTSAFIPRGVSHTIENHGSGPARFLFIMLPGGFERAFDDLAAAMAEHGELSPNIFADVMSCYDVRIVNES